MRSVPDRSAAPANSRLAVSWGGKAWSMDAAAKDGCRENGSPCLNRVLLSTWSPRWQESASGSAMCVGDQFQQRVLPSSANRSRALRIRASIQVEGGSSRTLWQMSGVEDDVAVVISKQGALSFAR